MDSYKTFVIFYTFRGITEARLVYSIIVILFILTIHDFYKNRSPRTHSQSQNKDSTCTDTASDDTSQTRCQSHRLLLGLLYCWTLLTVLLVRPHNIPLVAMMAIQEYALRHVVSMIEGISVPTLTLFYMWMGQAAFFYQVSYGTKF